MKIDNRQSLKIEIISKKPCSEDFFVQFTININVERSEGVCVSTKFIISSLWYLFPGLFVFFSLFFFFHSN